jgi:hypothetical protein
MLNLTESSRLFLFQVAADLVQPAVSEAKVALDRALAKRHLAGNEALAQSIDPMAQQDSTGALRQFFQALPE